MAKPKKKRAPKKASKKRAPKKATKKKSACSLELSKRAKAQSRHGGGSAKKPNPRGGRFK
jgi:hypothetical protein